MGRIVVVGAGILGAAISRELARAGHDVVVLERGAAASGTSGRGEGNILVSDKGPGPELDLARFSRTRWPLVARELREELGDEFPAVEFEPKGGLVVSTTDAGARPLLDFAASQRAAGVRADVIDARAAKALEPHLTDAITAAVHYPEDAQIQPVVATEAFLASARRSGARVLTGHEVIGAEVDSLGGLVGVRARSRSAAELRFPADAVVNAAGPWGAAVSEALGVPLPVLPRRGMVLVTTRMPHRVFHKVYDADYVGAVESSAADLQTSSVVESTASGTVLIGSSREQVGFRDEFRSRIVAELAGKAILLFPFLADASLMRSYSGFRPYMPDHLPVIGEDPRLPGLWHANGHEGAGIGLATGTAVQLAALLSGRPTPLDPAPFSVARESLAPFLETVAA